MNELNWIEVLTEAYPSNFWFIPALVLLILGGTALVDARTGRVPDLPLFTGTVVALACFAWEEGMKAMGIRFVIIVLTIFVLWFVNYLYFRATKRDGLGFGDAKWSGLAVAAFSVTTVIWTWVIAALSGLLWLAVLKRKRGIPFKQRAIHFAPFLFFGLLAVLAFRLFS
ncbi:MAG: A24 family peptidase [Alphaproteobacteria bacterium]|nr:A24 family peptidase [Alphaproteobacteria bacterium]